MGNIAENFVDVTSKRSIIKHLAIIVCSIIAIFSFLLGFNMNNLEKEHVSAQEVETYSEDEGITTLASLPSGASSWTDVYSVSLSSDSSYYIINGLQSAYSSITSIDIPDTINGLPVKEIGDQAFNGKSTITSVTLPESVTVLNNWSFGFCTSLTSVNMGGVQSIGAAAFNNCTALTSITIPESVTRIGYLAFYQCKALTQINFNAISCADLVSGTSSAFYEAGKSGGGGYHL